MTQQPTQTDLALALKALQGNAGNPTVDTLLQSLLNTGSTSQNPNSYELRNLIDVMALLSSQEQPAASVPL